MLSQTAGIEDDRAIRRAHKDHARGPACSNRRGLAGNSAYILVGGREPVDGHGVHEMSSSGRGQVLIPWPKRLEGGSYEFAKPDANAFIHLR
jgi:hypothetical protein